jgi:hypothetical protein
MNSGQAYRFRGQRFPEEIIVFMRSAVSAVLSELP